MTAISASILSCDPAFIGESAKRACASGAGSIHVDIMDGYYVENMTFGPELIRSLGNILDVPISVHLEVGNPDIIAPLFFDTPCTSIVFQTDTCSNPIHLLEKIRKAGKKAGVGLGPAYGIDGIKYILSHIDEIIVMSVEPGYAGQSFEDSVYVKLKSIGELMRERNRIVPLSVDGGVGPENAAALRDAGASELICGSSVFKGEDISSNIRLLLNALA